MPERKDQTGELTLRKRTMRIVWGLFLICLGSLVAWNSHDWFQGVFYSRLTAGVGGMMAMFGLMSALGSGAIGALMVLGGAGFFLWSLWVVSSGGGDTDVAQFGLWSGPLLAILGLVFDSPFKRSKASRSNR